jgi:peptidoglycan/xylan/chitin deacetylase (PgdA/CDA1 family)
VRVVSLEYHDVVAPEARDASGFPGRAAGSYKLTIGDFAAHVEALAREVPPAARRTALDVAGSPAPVLLTFDDGGTSAATVIAPQLESVGWRGHFFIATDYIGTPGFLTAAQLRELHARGHVVGSHSASHPLRMADRGPEGVLREWTTSVGTLSTVLGEPVRVASIPGGQYVRSVAAAAAAAGIRVLFTSEPTSATHVVDGCLVLGRFTLRDASSAALAVDFALGRTTARARQWLVWNGKKVAKRLGGSTYLRLRSSLLGD